MVGTDASQACFQGFHKPCTQLPLTGHHHFFLAKTRFKFNFVCGDSFNFLWSTWVCLGSFATVLLECKVQLISAHKNISSWHQHVVLYILQQIFCVQAVFRNESQTWNGKFRSIGGCVYWKLQELFMLPPRWQTRDWLSARTTPVNEQKLSAFPVRQHPLLNISNLLRQLSQRAFLSSVSLRVLTWRSRCCISSQTKKNSRQNKKKLIPAKHLEKSFRIKTNGSKWKKKKKKHEMISSSDHAVILGLFSPLKSSTHGLNCAWTTTVERIWLGHYL